MRRFGDEPIVVWSVAGDVHVQSSTDDYTFSGHDPVPVASGIAYLAADAAVLRYAIEPSPFVNDPGAITLGTRLLDFHFTGNYGLALRAPTTMGPYVVDAIALNGASTITPNACTPLAVALMGAEPGDLAVACADSIQVGSDANMVVMGNFGDVTEIAARPARNGSGPSVLLRSEAGVQLGLLEPGNWGGPGLEALDGRPAFGGGPLLGQPTIAITPRPLTKSDVVVAWTHAAADDAPFVEVAHCRDSGEDCCSLTDPLPGRMPSLTTFGDCVYLARLTSEDDSDEVVEVGRFCF